MKIIQFKSLAIVLISSMVLLTGCEEAEKMKQGTLDQMDQVFEKAKESLDKAKETIDTLTNGQENTPVSAPENNDQESKTVAVPEEDPVNTGE